MITKLFEIRDRLTFIPALAIQLSSETEVDRYLLSRAGYGLTGEEHAGYVALWPINGARYICTVDVYEHGTDRTLPVAHQYIISNWENLKSGDVIDVEFILGETTAAKQSERLETGRSDV